jgi:hypothetical protein
MSVSTWRCWTFAISRLASEAGRSHYLWSVSKTSQRDMLVFSNIIQYMVDYKRIVVSVLHNHNCDDCILVL